MSDPTPPPAAPSGDGTQGCTGYGSGGTSATHLKPPCFRCGGSGVVLIPCPGNASAAHNAPAASPPSEAPPLVHNHDLDPSCPEYYIDGRLVGRCMQVASKPTDEERHSKPGQAGHSREALARKLSALRKAHRELQRSHASLIRGFALTYRELLDLRREWNASQPRVRASEPPTFAPSPDREIL